MLAEFKTGHYLAFEISDKSRAHLLTMFPAQFSKVVAHHVTIEFNLTAEKFDNHKKMLTSQTEVRVYGYAKGDGIECVAVSINDEIDRADGSFYHVTLSLEPPHKPVESNLLETKVSGITNIFAMKTFTLDGTFKLIKK